MKKTIFIVATFAALLLLIEMMATLALIIRPTGNPLAFGSDEAALHIFAPPEPGMPIGVKPNYEQDFRSDEFDTVVRTNNVGFRENADFGGQRLDIAVVGDSFAFGHGVEAGERFSDLFRQEFPGRSVMSLAYPNGAELASYYLFLRRNPQYIPRMLVVSLFAWNDLRDDIAAMQLTFDEDGELTGAVSSAWTVNADGFLLPPDKEGWSEPWWRRLLRRFNTGRLSLILHHRLSREVARLAHEPGEEQRRDVVAEAAGGGDPRPEPARRFEDGELDSLALKALEFVARIQRLVSASGGDVVVLYVPASYRVGAYPFFCQTVSHFSDETCKALRRTNGLGGALADWFAARGIRFVDPTEDFRRLEAGGQRLYFDKDGHWNPAGHAAAATLLAPVLREGQVLSGS